MAELSTRGLTRASPEMFFGEDDIGKALAGCHEVLTSLAAVLEPTRPAGTPFTQRHIPILHFTDGKLAEQPASAWRGDGHRT
jgi:hypothetical protein